MPATRPLSCLAALLLTACAAAPTPQPDVVSPFVTSSGLVIGTLSYQYVDADPGEWTVHFQRVDGPASADYALAVDVDRSRHQGVFAGTLPAGVYAFRAAARDNRTFQTGITKVPFEVQAGEVRDAGHYALTPLQATE